MAYGIIYGTKGADFPEVAEDGPYASVNAARAAVDEVRAKRLGGWMILEHWMESDGYSITTGAGVVVETERGAVDSASLFEARIREMRAAAWEVGNIAQLSMCDIALGVPLYEVVAVLPDGQELRDEGHVGQAAGLVFAREAAEREAEDLEYDRPEGQEDVVYEIREAVAKMSQDDARAECARLIGE
jgi:hypothetical protein